MSLKIEQQCWAKSAHAFAKKIDKIATKADKALEISEDAARVPEGIFIATKLLLPQNAAASGTVNSIASHLSGFRGMISTLRVIPLAWNLARGRSFKGGPLAIVFNVILAATRALVLASFLQRTKAIHMPKEHATGVSFGISAGFTLLAALSFIKALGIWRYAKSPEGKSQRKQELVKLYQNDVNKGILTQKVARKKIKNQIEAEIARKGDDAISEGLELFITPVDTGALPQNATPLVVFPLVIFGSISAAIRLWRVSN